MEQAHYFLDAMFKFLLKIVLIGLRKVWWATYIKLTGMLETTFLFNFNLKEWKVFNATVFAQVSLTL